MRFQEKADRKAAEKAEEKELKLKKQIEMGQLDVNYERFMAKKISEKRVLLLAKYPDLKTIFQGWVYGIYVSILDYQPEGEKSGKLYYFFGNIPEASNKYKLSYTITDANECVFNSALLNNFPKSYLSVLKRNKLEIKATELTVRALICAHAYKADSTSYIHHFDYNKLNNNIKNLAPLEKSFFENLEEEQKKNLSKAQIVISEKYKIETKKKPKDILKLEYRVCDLYYNHKIEVDKIATTMRNRPNKVEIQRIVKFYTQFKYFTRKGAEAPIA